MYAYYGGLIGCLGNAHDLIMDIHFHFYFISIFISRSADYHGLNGKVWEATGPIVSLTNERRD